MTEEKMAKEAFSYFMKPKSVKAEKNDGNSEKHYFHQKLQSQ